MKPPKTFDDVCYQSSFLKEVIARIDFVTPLQEIEKNIPPKFAKVISSFFPVQEPTEMIAQHLQFGGEGPVRHRVSQVKNWNFHSK